MLEPARATVDIAEGTLVGTVQAQKCFLHMIHHQIDATPNSADARDKHAAAAANNAVLQDALDHALQEMDSVRKVVAWARNAHNQSAAASSLPQDRSNVTDSQSGLQSDDNDARLKAERIKELQRELAAVLDERDALQAQLETFLCGDHSE